MFIHRFPKPFSCCVRAQTITQVLITILKTEQSMCVWYFFFLRFVDFLLRFTVPHFSSRCRNNFHTWAVSVWFARLKALWTHILIDQKNPLGKWECSIICTQTHRHYNRTKDIHSVCSCEKSSNVLYNDRTTLRYHEINSMQVQSKQKVMNCCGNTYQYLKIMLHLI